jgi:hypothetical protein
MAEIKKVSDDMLHFLMALAEAFWKEYFGDEIVDLPPYNRSSF